MRQLEAARRAPRAVAPKLQPVMEHEVVRQLEVARRAPRAVAPKLQPVMEHELVRQMRPRATALRQSLPTTLGSASSARDWKGQLWTAVPVRRSRRKRSRMPWSGAAAVLLAAAGAGAMYVLDPERGKRRRALARDKAGALVRRAGRGAGCAVRWSAATGRATAGQARGLLPRRRGYDDVTLSHHVESELFRDPAIPKGRLSVDAAAGVVTLRGEVGSEDAIEKIRARARRISGVKEVKTLLHVQGTPAPNKVAALQGQAPPRVARDGPAPRVH